MQAAYQGYRWLGQRLRGAKYALWIRLWGGRVGRRLMVDRHVLLRHPPGSGWQLGDNVYIGYGAVLDVWPGGKLSLGNNTKLMHYVIVGVQERVSVGADCQLSGTLHGAGC